MYAIGRSSLRLSSQKPRSDFHSFHHSKLIRIIQHSFASATSSGDSTADAATGYKEGQLRGIWSVNFGDMEHTKEVVAALNTAIPEIKD